jgi:putative phosphonate metabolism protein
MEEAPRFAVYFAPEADSPLWAFGSSVLGRDAARDCAVEFPQTLLANFPDWPLGVTPAALYGFHATLKAPFYLTAGADESRLAEALTALAASLEPVMIGSLKVQTMAGRFVALVPVDAPTSLVALAGRIVGELDPLRAPLAEEDRRRRKPESLTARQVALLDRWGYPYVFEEFRFHMTLSGPLDGDAQPRAQRILSELYGDVSRPVRIGHVCICTQVRRDGPFKITHRMSLGR